ncbi:hypothetical protein [Rhodococcus sp. (in: high G+C Gram-positive bacteria)]|uniref:hypothetical protein n=1 Tax=Rhodococcus sp. TaxID=1831 RepID=UPI00389052CD
MNQAVHTALPPAPTVLDALRASPVGPVLDAPLPVLSCPAPPPPGELPQLPDANAITELLQSIPVPVLPDLHEFLRPLTELGSLFGTGVVEALDPSAVLQQGSRLLENATALGRSALHALPESWEGSTADSAADHGHRARQASVELADRGDRIGAVTRAATASVERGNIELTGIASSFVSIAIAAAPVAITPPGQAALIASAIEHVHAALAVVARTRGELAGHTGAMTALTTPIPVPAPVATALTDPRALSGLATDAVSTVTGTVSTLAGSAGPGGDASTTPSAYAPTVPAGHTLPNTVPSTAASGGMSSAFATPGAGYGSAGSSPVGLPPAVPGAGMTPGAPGGAGAASTAGTTGRGSMVGALPSTGGPRQDDGEHRTTPGFLVAAATSTDVVGDLPLVAPAVIGGEHTW